jgi:penicillin-binding protein 1C
VKTKRKKFLKALVLGSCIISALLGILWCLIPRCELYAEDVSWSPVLRDRDGGVLHLGLANDDRYRIHVPLDQISPTMVQATLAYEDEGFYSHGGVDPLSLLRAIGGRLQGVSRGGGSTITMQYARLRFKLSTRSIFGKLQQILYAIQLEKYYSKREILEAYFNTAPYGGNVEGIAAASLRWCEKDCRNLEVAEAVALVMLPQRPSQRRPRPGVEELPQTLAARNRLLHKLGYADAMLANYRWEKHLLPRNVPHLARRLRHQVENSSIDASLQAVVETTVQGYLMRMQEKGVRNASVMVVDAPTREVHAYVGSGGFFDDAIEGQIDGCRTRRSPGSLFKPFLYCLAIDQGILHPHTLLADAPMRFRDYNPENNERDFLGPVKASEALYRSRNLPALSLMPRLAGKGLYGFLQASGLRMDHGAGHYGMALALGAAAASPEEMAMLYAALADDGKARPLVYGSSQSKEKHQAILSDGARWLLRQMMIDPQQKNAFAEGAISFKTGTSQGYRDAWSIGISGRTVVVVWLGNFDVSSNPALQGRTMAAPLMNEIFRHTGKMMPLPAPPSTVKEVELCAVSGMIPSEYCKNRCRSWVLADVSPIVPCDMHRLVWVDQRTGLRVAPRDDDPQVKAQIFEFWKPEFLELFRLAGLPRRAIPESVEVTAESNEPPKIQLPMRDHVYQIRDGSQEGLICKAKAAVGVTRVFWFGNGVLLGSTHANEAFFWKDASGGCEIQVMDDRGMSDQVRVQVERVSREP